MPEIVIAPPPASGRRELPEAAADHPTNSPITESEPTAFSPDEVSNGATLESLELADSRRQESPPTVQKDDKRGRPAIFDDIMKAKVIGLITAGVSQRAAAAYQGIDQSTISKAICRDEDFAREIEKARAASRIKPFLCIVKASRKDYKAAFRLLQHLRGDEHLREYDPPTPEEAAEMRAQAARDDEEETYAHFEQSRRVFDRLRESRQPKPQEKYESPLLKYLEEEEGRQES
jgi:hypothetical protein